MDEVCRSTKLTKSFNTGRSTDPTTTLVMTSVSKAAINEVNKDRSSTGMASKVWRLFPIRCDRPDSLAAFDKAKPPPKIRIISHGSLFWATFHVRQASKDGVT